MSQKLKLVYYLSSFIHQTNFLNEVVMAVARFIANPVKDIENAVVKKYPDEATAKAALSKIHQENHARYTHEAIGNLKKRFTEKNLQSGILTPEEAENIGNNLAILSACIQRNPQDPISSALLDLKEVGLDLPRDKVVSFNRM